MSYFHGDEDAPRYIAINRSLEALGTKTLHNPEFYPFAVAREAAEFAIAQANPKQIPKKRMVPTALKVANEVAGTYDEISLKNWFAFSEPAQDMAWRGFSDADILSAAINTSVNTYVRTTGYLISELTEIQPSSILKVQENYNQYADTSVNEQLHQKIIGQVFEDVIAQGLKQNSALPFMHAANNQNAALVEGKTLGWCASALHAAGVAYDMAQKRGEEAAYFAREEFEGKRSNTKWQDLKKLGKRIIKSYREGAPVAMSDMEDMTKGIDGLKNLLRSVEKTMNDPHYKQTHERSRPKPKTPAASLRATMPSPIPAAPLPGPGLGTSGTAYPPAQQDARTTDDSQQ